MRRQDSKRKASNSINEAVDPKRRKFGISGSGSPQIWKNITDALKGIPQSEVEEYRKDNACLRCGRDGHRILQCYARKSIKGTDLPIHPSQEGVTARANAIIRNDPVTETEASGMTIAAI